MKWATLICAVILVSWYLATQTVESRCDANRGAQCLMDEDCGFGCDCMNVGGVWGTDRECR